LTNKNAVVEGVSLPARCALTVEGGNAVGVNALRSCEGESIFAGVAVTCAGVVCGTKRRNDLASLTHRSVP